MSGFFWALSAPLVDEVVEVVVGLSVAVTNGTMSESLSLSLSLSRLSDELSLSSCSTFAFFLPLPAFVAAALRFCSSSLSVR
jgi:hypothetical protein